MESCDLVRDTLELVIVEDKASSVKEAQETLFDKPQKGPIISTRHHRKRASCRLGQDARRGGKLPGFLAETQRRRYSERWRSKCYAG